MRTLLCAGSGRHGAIRKIADASLPIVERYGHWLAGSELLPKLFINADPGAQIVGRIRDFCRRWPNQREVTVPGIHFIQEDSADQIGAAIREFVGNLRR